MSYAVPDEPKDHVDSGDKNEAFRQPVRFLAAGALNTIVGYGAYAAGLYFFHLQYLHSLIIAQVIGTLHSFLWHKYWTFKSRQKPGKELVKFTCVYLATFLLNFPLLMFLVEVLKMGAYWGQGISLLILAVISYLGHKYWSFAGKEDGR